jgi:hypothetical protein
MSDYLASDDKVTIPVYIDKRNPKKFAVLSENDVKEMVEDERLALATRIATLDAQTELNDEERAEKERSVKALEDLGKTEIPAYYTREETYWIRPDGAIDEYIDVQGYDRNDVTGKVVYNRPKYDRAFVGTLLKGWTLEKDSPRLKLEFVAIPGFQTKMMLAPKSVEAIWSLRPEILAFLTSEPYRVLIKGELVKK